MSAVVLQWRGVRREACAWCNQRFMRMAPVDGRPSYCSYLCGVHAQPKATKTEMGWGM